MFKSVSWSKVTGPPILPTTEVIIEKLAYWWFLECACRQAVIFASLVGHRIFEICARHERGIMHMNGRSQSHLSGGFQKILWNNRDNNIRVWSTVQIGWEIPFECSPDDCFISSCDATMSITVSTFAWITRSAYLSFLLWRHAWQKVSFYKNLCGRFFG